MVTTVYFLITLLTAPVAFSHALPELEVELTPKRFYPGQTISVNFILHAEEPFLEAEVMKFPEFRGFWSENMTLRQGPLQLVERSRRHPGARQFLIGSYSLQTILTKANPTILPMKIAIRSPNQTSPGPLVLESLESPMELIPLPKIPPDLKSLPFLGAVGSFRATTGSPTVSFIPNEPAIIRWNLEGDGNFAEISELPVAFPDNMQKLSEHTSVLDHGTESIKTFEFLMTIHQDTDTEFPGYRATYFEPQTAEYKLIEWPATPLKVMIPVQPATIDPESASPESQTAFLPDSSWDQQILFWLILVSIVGINFYILWFGRRKRAPYEPPPPDMKPRMTWKQVEASFQDTSSDSFLDVSNHWIRNCLEEKFPEIRLMPTNQAIRSLSNKLPAELITKIQELNNARMAKCFSRQHDSGLKPSTCYELIRQVKSGLRL